MVNDNYRGFPAHKTAEQTLQAIIDNVYEKVTDDEITMDDLNVAAVTLLNVREYSKVEKNENISS